MKTYYVYILSNVKNSVLYVGVTNDLLRRVYEHKMHLITGFSDKYNATKLVYYETSVDIRSAIEREKKLKNRHRAFKIKLIEAMNPSWRDLFDDFI